MSEIPGYTLEKFIMWDHDLIIAGDPSANWSLQAAELLGTNSKRRDRQLTGEQFKQIVAIYEPQREMIELLLKQFDEQDCGWRQYCSNVFTYIPEAIFLTANTLITTLLYQPR